VSAAAGAWEDGTQAQALTGLGITIGTSGKFSYSNGTSLGSTTNYTTDGNGLIGLTYASFGTTPASTGSLRLPGGNLNGLVRNSNTPGTDIGVLSWDTSDNLYVGDGSAGGNFFFNAPSGKTLSFRIAGTVEYAFDAAGLDIKTNYIAHGTGAAANGALRFSNLDDVWAKNTGGTSLRVLAMGDDLFVGDTAGGDVYLDAGSSKAIRGRVNGTTELVLDASNLTLATNNIALTAGALKFGATPAASAYMRFPTAAGPLIHTVNYDSTGDMAVLETAGNTTFTDIYLGDDGSKGSSTIYFGTKLQFVFRMAGTDEMVLTSSSLDIKDNVVKSGADPASGGVFRMSYASGGSTWLAFKHGSSGAAVSVLTQVALTNDILIGDPTHAPGSYTKLTSTNVLIDPDAAGSGYSFNNGSSNFHANLLYFGNGGSVCFYAADNSTVIGALSNGSTSGLDFFQQAANNFVFTVGATQRMKLSSSALLLSTDLNFSGVGGNSINSAKYVEYTQASTPANPGSTGWRLWTDGSGNLKAVNSAGTVRTLAVP